VEFDVGLLSENDVVKRNCGKTTDDSNKGKSLLLGNRDGPIGAINGTRPARTKSSGSRGRKIKFVRGGGSTLSQWT